MDKIKIAVVLLVVAILFSVVSTILSVSLMDFKPTINQPNVVYQTEKGNPESGVSINVLPQGAVP